MKHNPHLHVIFNNHKCYFVGRANKKTFKLGIEEHGIFRLVDVREPKEYLLMAISGQNSNELWHQRNGHLKLRSLSYLAKKSLVD
jgi:hypothetical protein